MNGGEQQNVSCAMKKYLSAGSSKQPIVSLSRWERAGAEGAQLKVEPQIRTDCARLRLALRKVKETTAP